LQLFLRGWRGSLPLNHAALVDAYLSAIGLFTILLHRLALHFAGLLLPKDRTSLFVWRIPRAVLSGWRIKAWKGMDPSKAQLNI
jgi:hypothetical protein